MDKYLVKRPHGIILYMFMEQLGPITQKFSENARLHTSPALPLMPVTTLVTDGFELDIYNTSVMVTSGIYQIGYILRH